MTSELSKISEFSVYNMIIMMMTIIILREKYRNKSNSFLFIANDERAYFWGTGGGE